MDRCAVLVDAGYMMGAAATLLDASGMRSSVTADWAPMMKSLVELAQEQTGLPVLRVLWYDAWYDGRPAPEHLVLGSLPDVKVRLGVLVRHGQRMEQKGVDSFLQRDMTTLARNKSVADIVLISGDEDIRRGVDEAQDFGVKVHLWGVEAGAPQFNQARSLITEADRRFVLSEEWVRKYVRIKPRYVGPPPPPAELAKPVVAEPAAAPSVEAPVGAPVAGPLSPVGTGGAVGGLDGVGAVDAVGGAVSPVHPGPLPAAKPVPARPEPAHAGVPVASAATPAVPAAPAAPAAPTGTSTHVPRPGEPVPAAGKGTNGHGPKPGPRPSGPRPASPSAPVPAPPPAHHPGPDPAIMTLAELSTERQKWRDNEEDSTSLLSQPFDVGRRYGARWASRATPALLARVRVGKPVWPEAIQRELLKFAHDRGMDAYDDDEVQSAVRDGAWRALEDLARHSEHAR